MKRNELLHLICTPMETITSQHIKFRRDQLKKLINMIRIDEVLNYLKKNPDIVEKWISYARGRQNSPGYYFLSDHPTKEFGYYDSDSDKRIVIFKSKELELIVTLFIIFDSKLNNTFFHI